MKQVEPVWIGWTAGIIDGEGTITIVPVNKKGCRNTVYVVRVTAASIDFEMIEQLHNLWGGSYRWREDKRKNRLGHYAWVLANKNTIPLLEQILPFLTIKHKQATVALILQNRITNRMGFAGQALSDAELEIRKELYNNNKWYNSREGKRPWLVKRNREHVELVQPCR